MNVMKVFLTFLALTTVGALAAQQRGMTSEPAVMIAGSEVRISYNSQGTVLEGKHLVTAVAYVYDNYRWKIHDVELSATGKNLWEGSFVVPAQSGFVAFKFHDSFSTHPDVIDNNDNKGYLFQVYNKKHQLMPGASIGKAAFLTPSVMSAPGYIGVNNYFDPTDKDCDRSLLKSLVDAEKKSYPKNRRQYFYEEVYLYKELLGEHASQNIKSTLSEIARMNNLGEDELFNLSFAYLFLLNDKEKSHEIDQMMIKRFPKGRLARRKAMEIPYSVKGEEYFKKAEQVRQDFPVMDFYRKPDYQSYLYSNFYRRLSQELFDAKKYDQLEELLKEMNSSMIEDAFLHQPKQSMKFPDRDPHTYYQIALRYIEELRNKLSFPGNTAGSGLSPLQARYQHRQTFNYYLTVMTELARRTGHYQQAVELMDAIPIEERFNYDPTGNEAYVRCLEQLGQEEKILEVLKASAAHNKMTPHLMEMLKTYYTSSPQAPASSFDEYLYSLKTPEAKEELLKHVSQGLVSDNYTPFDIEDINGGRVRSDDFSADDIVVLDFWATWCAPCCAALVGMQMAVEHYIDDSHIKFYFVDTQDRATKEQLNNYWKEKGYHDMLIAFDEDTPGTHDGSRVYRILFPNASGIPQKAILKNGKVRYRASGYQGSPSELMDELITVIETLKKENINK